MIQISNSIIIIQVASETYRTTISIYKNHHGVGYTVRQRICYVMIFRSEYVMIFRSERASCERQRQPQIITRPVFCKQNSTSRLIFESDLSRSPKLKLILLSNPRPMTPYKCSIVTNAISLGHPVFQQMTLI